MSSTTEKKTYTQQLLQETIETPLPRRSERRRRAWEQLASQGLPEGKTEEYKFTPITRALSKTFDVAELISRRPAVQFDFNDSLIDNLDCYKLVFCNGNFIAASSSLPNQKGFTITPLSQTEEPENDMAEISPNDDPFALFNEAWWQDGVLMEVGKNVIVDKPVVIYHYHDATNLKVASHTRLVVRVASSGSLTIVEKTNSKGGNAIFNTIKEEIVVEQNATFNYCKIQDDGGELVQINNTTIHQHNNSRTNTYTFTLNGKVIRNNLNIIIDGEGCESHFFGLYLAQGDTHVDNHTVVDHRKPNSFSNEMYKGMMDDKSKGVFNGKIYVRPHAQKTNAFQSNRNILLSDAATVNAKPQLEIWADDVKCSHGCTTGQLDDEALFYLRSRGIPKASAKAMLLYAFAGEVIEAIGDEHIRNYVDEIVSARLHKDF